ncbi:MAG TPA: hypothetical protein V6C63_12805 [Allocoleopsis sp.]
MDLLLHEAQDQEKTDYLFFLDGLLEVSKAPETDKFGYALRYGINVQSLYNSPAFYRSAGRAWRHAKWKAIRAAVDRSRLIMAACDWTTDACLVQSEDAIDLFGDAVYPACLKAHLFFPNPEDRAQLRQDLKQNSRTEARLTLQNLELKKVTGKVELQIIPVSKNVAYTLEIFTPDDGC